MWPFKTTKHEYRAVASDEDERKVENGQREGSEATPRRNYRLVIVIGAILVVITLCFVATYLVLSSSTTDTNQPPTSEQDSDRCPRRQEWRTLTPTQQTSYISAVLCLRNQSSTLAPSNNAMTAYDDFPWIHSRVGYFTHHSAPFLPWHRYFLHIYETTLRNQCGYQGNLVYWDWTLDASSIETSPVFDAETGFGGDGEVGGEITVSNTGRCVVDGPFAGIEVPFYDVKYQPHCLSRGFRDLEGKMGHIDGTEITPEGIEEVLGTEGYELFVTLMESRVHDAIPYGISGDFETFTAPYGKSVCPMCDIGMLMGC